MIQANIKPMPTKPKAWFRMLVMVRSGRMVGLSIPNTTDIPRPMAKKWMTWLPRNLIRKEYLREEAKNRLHEEFYFFWELR
jgi:hypothetical protein